MTSIVQYSREGTVTFSERPLWVNSSGRGAQASLSGVAAHTLDTIRSQSMSSVMPVWVSGLGMSALRSRQLRELVDMKLSR